jgi:hypothetical protein
VPPRPPAMSSCRMSSSAILIAASRRSSSLSESHLRGMRTNARASDRTIHYGAGGGTGYPTYPSDVLSHARILSRGQTSIGAIASRTKATPRPEGPHQQSDRCRTPRPTARVVGGERKRFPNSQARPGARTPTRSRARTPPTNGAERLRPNRPPARARSGEEHPPANRLRARSSRPDEPSDRSGRAPH